MKIYPLKVTMVGGGKISLGEDSNKNYNMEKKYKVTDYIVSKKNETFQINVINLLTLVEFLNVAFYGRTKTLKSTNLNRENTKSTNRNF